MFPRAGFEPKLTPKGPKNKIPLSQEARGCKN